MNLRSGNTWLPGKPVQVTYAESVWGMQVGVELWRSQRAYSWHTTTPVRLASGHFSPLPIVKGENGRTFHTNQTTNQATMTSGKGRRGKRVLHLQQQQEMVYVRNNLKLSVYVTLNNSGRSRPQVSLEARTQGLRLWGRQARQTKNSRYELNQMQTFGEGRPEEETPLPGPDSGGSWGVSGIKRNSPGKGRKTGLYAAVPDKSGLQAVPVEPGDVDLKSDPRWTAKSSPRPRPEHDRPCSRPRSERNSHTTITLRTGRIKLLFVFRGTMFTLTRIEAEKNTGRKRRARLMVRHPMHSDRGNVCRPVLAGERSHIFVSSLRDARLYFPRVPEVNPCVMAEVARCIRQPRLKNGVKAVRYDITTCLKEHHYHTASSSLVEARNQDSLQAEAVRKIVTLRARIGCPAISFPEHVPAAPVM
ncbi:hypothetical protein Bbelb_112620 [Branchiostoma belcheri]|nr:hypothetical protein Bbelb_112620 [Branchiostoma belcheri]